MLIIWDIPSGRKIFQFLHKSPINSCSFSPDGKTVTTSGKDGAISICDLVTGQLTFLSGHGGAVKKSFFSPSGSEIFSGGMDSSIKIWDSASRENNKTLKIFHLDSSSDFVQFNSNGQQAVISTELGGIQLLSSLNFQEELSLFGHQALVTALHFSPEETEIVSGGKDHLLKIWDASSGQEVWSKKGGF